MSRVTRLVTHNSGLKLLSLVAATGLWWLVAAQPLAEIEHDVPIEFQNVPPELEFASETVPRVRVRLRGPDRLVRQVSPDEIHASIDVAGKLGVTPGERSYELNPSRITVPSGIEVVRVTPSFVRLSFDRRATKTVPVRPRITGTLAPGFHITSATVEPSKVLIVGPAQRLEGVDAAFTDPIDATGLMSASRFPTSIYVADPMVRISGGTQVRVTIGVSGNGQ